MLGGRGTEMQLLQHWQLAAIKTLQGSQAAVLQLYYLQAFQAHALHTNGSQPVVGGVQVLQQRQLGVLQFQRSQQVGVQVQCVQGFQLDVLDAEGV